MIENIGKIIGLELLCGRTIIAAGDYDDKTHPDHSNYYKFVVGECTDSGTDYDKMQEIVLMKKTGGPYAPYDENKKKEYQMFNMGLQARTFEWLTLSQIKDISQLATFMDNVMRSTYEYYKNK